MTRKKSNDLLFIALMQTLAILFIALLLADMIITKHIEKQTRKKDPQAIFLTPEQQFQRDIFITPKPPR